jgi:hypothetical protein
MKNIKDSKTCGHVKPSRLEWGYGFGSVSGWTGIGITFRCPRCAECLWFIDDNDCSPKEISHNDLKRKANAQWKPKKKIGPHPYKHISLKNITVRTSKSSLKS